MKHYSIQPANLEFNAEGTPVSRDFDDVYFSNDNGLEETRYVFLGGNQLEVRFPEHPHPLFVVAESGFGTGLNFLTLWQAFDQFREAHPQARLQRLHFISFEKFPHPCGFSHSASTLAGTGSVGRTTSGAVANALARLPSFITR